ncbi:hypothetical protein [Polaribacter sp.]|uniref:hypothetical protein n=1 Tax=Polaribacter sp. TaxID=1920175 RepID=UPI003F6A40E0
MNEKQKHIKELLNEITKLRLENQLRLDKIPFENCDMETYEGTKVEDLGNSLYFRGKIDMLEEIKDTLMVDFSTN